jgi:Trp operon repressor
MDDLLRKGLALCDEMDMRETSDHRNRNDEVFLVTKRTRPDLFARLLSLLTPSERADVEQRVARSEQREGR